MSTRPILQPDWLSWPQTQRLIEAFSSQPDAIRFVGGAVRDSILNRMVHDVDAATTLTPEAVLTLLGNAGVKAIPTGIAHGTVTAVIDDKHFEITTLRKDVSCDGRHAQIEYTQDWQEDAKRRDFTMNALYLSVDGTLYDDVDGMKDAKSGTVRFIGNAAQRIDEDHLRILRFFRFYAHYGKGDPDREAIDACANAASHITQLSGERLQKELLKILEVAHPYSCLRLMQSHNILAYSLGVNITSLESIECLSAIEEAQSYSLEPFIKLALLQRKSDQNEIEASKHIAEHLRLSNVQSHTLTAIANHHDAYTSSLSPSKQKHFIRTLGKDLCRYIIFVNWASDAEASPQDAQYQEMLSLCSKWQPPRFPVSGQDLLSIGIKPGKAMGEMLRSLESWWESEDYQPSRPQLLKRAKEQVAD